MKSIHPITLRSARRFGFRRDHVHQMRMAAAWTVRVSVSWRDAPDHAPGVPGPDARWDQYLDEDLNSIGHPKAVWPGPAHRRAGPFKVWVRRSRGSMRPDLSGEPAMWRNERRGLCYRQRKLARSRFPATTFRLSNTAPFPPKRAHFSTAIALPWSRAAALFGVRSMITVLLLAATN